MSLSPPLCRDWQARGSCRFAQRCRFQHDSSVAARAEAPALKKSNITASNVSQPLIISASGSKIHFSSHDGKKWAQLLRQLEMRGTFRPFAEEFTQRFLLALFQPMLPHQALVLALNFSKGIQGNAQVGYYHVAHHLNSPHELQRCGFSYATSGNILRGMVSKQIARFLSIQASQDLGFARLARLCYIQHHGLSGLTAHHHTLFDVGAFWECSHCSNPNENMERPTCAACGCIRSSVKNLLLPRASFFSSAFGLDTCKERFEEPLAASDVVKKMQKLRKKLNQVGVCAQTYLCVSKCI
jgi:hypothetical protein